MWVWFLNASGMILPDYLFRNLDVVNTKNIFSAKINSWFYFFFNVEKIKSIFFFPKTMLLILKSGVGICAVPSSSTLTTATRAWSSAPRGPSLLTQRVLAKG